MVPNMQLVIKQKTKRYQAKDAEKNVSIKIQSISLKAE